MTKELPKGKKSKEKKDKSDPKKESEKFAVIETGGKQYVVVEGKKYDFEKLSAEEGKEVKFSEVLLVTDGKEVKIGQPYVNGAMVSGVVVSQFKDKKITVLKYKPKKRYKKVLGHRQPLTKVEISHIKLS